MRDTNLPYIGVIPDSWKLALLGRFASEVQAPNSDCAESNALQFKMGSIISKSVGDSKYHPETLEGYNVVLPGDIIINGLNLNYDLKSLRVGQVVEKGVITAAYIAIRPHGISTGFLKYLLKGFDYIKTFHGMGKGIRLTLSYGELKKMFIPVPPIEVQQRIADFLDAKCSEIDYILERTQASIEDYKTLKLSVITEAVTKGIRGDRPMKESGVEWIGDIPMNWNTVALKALCRMKAGKNLTTEQIADEGSYPVYGGNGVRGFYHEYMCDGIYLLVGRQGALCGNVHRVEGRFWPTEHALVTTPSSITDIHYLYYLLVGANLNQYSSDSAAQPGLSVGAIRNIRVVLPPIPEQQEIAAYLDEKCAAIDSLIASKEALITELEAYKKSIIYEYVTGKKEV